MHGVRRRLCVGPGRDRQLDHRGRTDIRHDADAGADHDSVHDLSSASGQLLGPDDRAERGRQRRRVWRQRNNRRWTVPAGLRPSLHHSELDYPRCLLRLPVIGLHSNLRYRQSASAKSGNAVCNRQ